jgi:hypothetical protein
VSRRDIEKTYLQQRPVGDQTEAKAMLPAIAKNLALPALIYRLLLIRSKGKGFPKTAEEADDSCRAKSEREFFYGFGRLGSLQPCILVGTSQ